MLAAQKREQESREDVDLLDWLEANAARYDANMFVMGILGDPNHRTLISRAVIRTARATDAARAASTEDGDVQNARDRAVIFDRSQTTGGLSLDECPMPGTTKGGTPLCCCGNCRRCGWPKHAAIHLAAYGAERGSRPVGHRFKERRP